VAGSRTQTTAGSSIQRVDGNQLLKVDGALTTSIGKSGVTMIRGDQTVNVQGSHGMVVGTPEEDGACTVDVSGTYSVGVTRSIRLTATTSLRLTCGKSVIEITPEEIRLEAKALTLIGASSVSMEGDGPSLHLTDKALMNAKAITVKTDQAFLKLEENASLNGKLVKLNCDTVDEAEGDERPEEKPKSFRLKVADDYEKPYAGKKYTLLVDGTPYEGETGADGLVEQDLPPTAESGELVVWLEEPGKGRKLRWLLKLRDLPPIETPQGVRARLKNLGYLLVAEGQAEDPERDAIRAFQRDQGLSPTGVIDEATREKLGSAHGH